MLGREVGLAAVDGCEVSDGAIGVGRGYVRGLQQVTRRLDRFDKPTIAAVNGCGLRGGAGDDDKRSSGTASGTPSGPGSTWR